MYVSSKNVADINIYLYKKCSVNLIYVTKNNEGVMLSEMSPVPAFSFLPILLYLRFFFKDLKQFSDAKP